MPQVILLEKSLEAAGTPNWFVVLMGIGTVFFGLVCIIAICSLMGLFFRRQNNNTVPATPVAPGKTDENRQEILAAVCAVAAEELGTDVSALKVISFKKI